MKFPGFVGGSYGSQSPIADQERTVNWYVEEIETTGTRALYPTPGVEEVALIYPTLVDPVTPSIANVGTAGATTYGYKVVALLGDGTTHTAASSEGTTTTGNATLDSTNYNTISWGAVAGAVYYNVYRTTGGATPPMIIAELTTALTLSDTGIVGESETPPSTNTSGGAVSLAGAGRAHREFAGRDFMVIGSVFAEVLPGTTEMFFPRGLVAASTSPATIAFNGDNELFLTSGGYGYEYDLTTNVLTQIAALDGKATMCSSIDGYFLALDAATGTVYISDLLDGLTWDSTQFFTPISASDRSISMLVATPYIYFWGTATGEVWYNAGTFPLPFARTSSGLMQYGCAAPFSPEVVGGAVVWLGQTVNGDGAVLKATAFTPEVVSTYALRTAFQRYDTLADAIGDTYDWMGHTFYVLTFPTANASWAWDSALPLPLAWHEPLTWVSEDVQYTAWRPLWHAFVFGEHRVLDRKTGDYYKLAEVGTDADSRPIRRMRRTPALVSENKRLFYSLLEILLEPGLGLSGTGQGSNPSVMLRMSSDGGKTWGAERTRRAGKRGEYDTRVRWLRCGSGRKRVFEVVVTDAIPWRLMDAFLKVTGASARGKAA